MKQPEVEFFSEDVDGHEYLNVGFKFYIPNEEEPIRCVLGAFGEAPAEDGLRIIKALVEEACIYMQGVYSGEIQVQEDEPKLEIVKNELVGV
jgi:hypothetical protein